MQEDQGSEARPHHVLMRTTSPPPSMWRAAAAFWSGPLLTSSLPCATQNEIDKESAAKQLGDKRRCGASAEGANMPCTPEAICRHSRAAGIRVYGPGQGGQRRRRCYLRFGDVPEQRRDGSAGRLRRWTQKLQRHHAQSIYAACRRGRGEKYGIGRAIFWRWAPTLRAS